eukprot:5321661-Alexandrium_andersonii.AAC.1
MHASGVLRTKFVAVPGSVRFKLRTPETRLHVLKGGLRIEADCSIGGPAADCGVHLMGTSPCKDRSLSRAQHRAI